MPVALTGFEKWLIWAECIAYNGEEVCMRNCNRKCYIPGAEGWILC
jgi:hypothetical protein